MNARRRMGKRLNTDVNGYDTAAACVEDFIPY